MTYKYDIAFDNGKYYSYAGKNVTILHDPEILKTDNYIIETPDGKKLYSIKKIYEFDDKGQKYWHIVLEGFELDYKKSDLRIEESCLSNKKSANTFDYLKEISALSEIPNDYGEIILKKYYDRVTFIPRDSALSVYLKRDKKIQEHSVNNVIFPFGCNQSQYQAVKNALNNQISVIQGPPGTGKTQTILNIIANLLINRKSVIVVSNNNSAIKNVLEKLANDKYRMDFLVASLGSADNKNAFVEAQTGAYPDLSNWGLYGEEKISIKEVTELSQKLQKVYKLQEELAKLKERHFEIGLEYKHFLFYTDDTAVDYRAIKVRGKRSSKKIMQLWQELQDRAESVESLSIWFKLRSILVYGIADWKFYKQDLSKIITVLQGMYYKQVLEEIEGRIKGCENELSGYQGDYEKQLEEKSLKFLKSDIATSVNWQYPRKIFSIEDMYKNASAVLKEYPIIISTTFSARASLNPDTVEYDYVIMDEASQVDVATGALALSCAKNAVIVGDLKQLPNVITTDTRNKAEQIRKQYNIPDAYDYAKNSFLKSIVEVKKEVPTTLLREHYRCHPRIISFCNQKFYGGDLVIMTEDDNLGKALKAVKTVEGNHARGHYNQREIDVIKDEILPDIDAPDDEIGIITPYNDQVKEIRKQIPTIDAATVHKFQGREKDVIILSTVDNEIKDFTDDPYLLNVAVSRAKKQLIVVTSGNKQADKGNIVDLISYIQYNGMEVIDSKTFSVFDYLYSQYREQRWRFLKNKKRISQYESENLVYNMLIDMLEDYPEYGVQCFVPLSMVVRDLSMLSDEEVKYALNPATHLDFMIFNKVSKRPVAAIEVDGYAFHNEKTEQYQRDLKKNHILELTGLKLIRLNTTGSNERERVLGALGI